MRLPEEHTREVFRQIDTDQDGYITTGELVDSARGVLLRSARAPAVQVIWLGVRDGERHARLAGVPGGCFRG